MWWWVGLKEPLPVPYVGWRRLWPGAHPATSPSISPIKEDRSARPHHRLRFRRDPVRASDRGRYRWPGPRTPSSNGGAACARPQARRRDRRGSRRPSCRQWDFPRFGRSASRAAGGRRSCRWLFRVGRSGSATERVVLGFGAGGAELKTVVRVSGDTPGAARARFRRGRGGQRQDAGRSCAAGRHRRDRQSARPCRFRRGEGIRRGVRLGDDRRRSPTHSSGDRRQDSAYSRETGVDLVERWRRGKSSLLGNMDAESGEPPRRAAIDRRRLRRYLQQEWQIARQARENDERDTRHPTLISVRRDWREDASTPPFSALAGALFTSSNRRVGGGPGQALRPPGH